MAIANGCKTLRALNRTLGVATQCGQCGCCIKRILRDTLAEDTPTKQQASR